MSYQIIWAATPPHPQLRNCTTYVVVYRLHTELRKVAEQAAKLGVVRRQNIHIFTLITTYNISYDIRVFLHINDMYFLIYINMNGV